GWGLEPTLGRQQVDPAVAVDVAGADAVAGGLLTEVVLLPARLRALRLQPIPDHRVHRVGQDLGDPVAGQVDQDRGLTRARLVDRVVGPSRAGLAGVLDPADVPREVRAGDEVGLAVAVDVHGQGGEAVAVRALALDVADLERLLEVGPAIPLLARDDVELAVVV